MYHSMTDSQLNEEVQKHIDAMNAMGKSSIAYFKHRQEEKSHRDAIHAIWAEQRFRRRSNIRICAHAQ